MKASSQLALVLNVVVCTFWFERERERERERTSRDLGWNLIYESVLRTQAVY